MAWDHPKAVRQWGQGHQLPLHMSFPRTSSCHAHAPLQFPKEGKEFKSNFWISCSKETDSLLPFTQKGAVKGRDRSSCRASSVPWTQPWELGTAGEGDTGVLGVKSREVKAMAPAPSHCIFLPKFGVQGGLPEDLPLALLNNHEIAIRSASAYGCSVPQGRSWTPSGRLGPASSRTTGRAVGMHLAGACPRPDDRMGPTETSQLCGAGWQPTPRLPLPPSCLASHLPFPAFPSAACAGMHQDHTHTSCQTQAAAGCSDLAGLGSVLSTSSARKGFTDGSHRAGMLLPHH